MTAEPAPEYDIEHWRSQVPLLGAAIPMNHCSQAPQTRLARDAALAYLDSWAVNGMDWDAWMAEVEAARAAFARLINAAPDEVAVTTSVSAAVASLASALDFTGERRGVLATEAEFPTVGHVWLAQERRGARVDWVPLRDGALELEDYRDRIDERTQVVSATQAYYQNGFLQDPASIARLAHARGAWLFVDAYQAMGTLPLDVRAADIDFLASGNLKYLMGIPGIAFLYVRSSLVEQLEPLVTGWFGRRDPFAFDVRRLDWASSARRFDTGTPPIINAYIARAGMEMLETVGLDRIQRWTTVLSNRLVEGGRERGLTLSGPPDPTRKAPTTAFHVPGDAHAVEVALRERGVIASARGPAIRLAPHFYNTREDVDAALDALSAVLRQS